MNIRFLADMNISPNTVKALQQKGWDIIRVSNLLPINSSDQEILKLARREGRVLVSQDLDFSTLMALSGHNRPSLVTIRMSVSDPETITERLIEVLPGIEKALQEGCAVTIEDIAFRIRRLPIE